jgi:hypothetical protein
VTADARRGARAEPRSSHSDPSADFLFSIKANSPQQLEVSE